MRSLGALYATRGERSTRGKSAALQMAHHRTEHQCHNHNTVGASKRADVVPVVQLRVALHAEQGLGMLTRMSAHVTRLQKQTSGHVVKENWASEHT